MKSALVACRRVADTKSETQREASDFRGKITAICLAATFFQRENAQRALLAGTPRRSFHHNILIAGSQNRPDLVPIVGRVRRRSDRPLVREG
jgi:hypothetical protein